MRPERSEDVRVPPEISGEVPAKRLSEQGADRANANVIAMPGAFEPARPVDEFPPGDEEMATDVPRLSGRPGPETGPSIAASASPRGGDSALQMPRSRRPLSRSEAAMDRRSSDRPEEESSDLLTNLPSWCCGIAIGAFGAAAMLTDSARPGFRQTGFAAMLGRKARVYWERDTLQIALGFAVLCFVVSVLGLVLKSRRVRRETDRFDIVAIILTLLGTLSGVGIAWYALRFL